MGTWKHRCIGHKIVGNVWPRGLYARIAVEGHINIKRSLLRSYPEFKIETYFDQVSF